MGKEELGPVVVSPLPAQFGGMPPRARRGRGFSIGEVRQAALTIQNVRLYGGRVDQRRKSVRQENVDRLKEWFALSRKLKAELKPKVVEPEKSKKQPLAKAKKPQKKEKKPKEEPQEREERPRRRTRKTSPK